MQVDCGRKAKHLGMADQSRCFFGLGSAPSN
jgi:hypothetical protein